MRGGCLLAVGARRARGSNKFSSVRTLRQPSERRRPHRGSHSRTHETRLHAHVLAWRPPSGGCLRVELRPARALRVCSSPGDRYKFYIPDLLAWRPPSGVAIESS